MHKNGSWDIRVHLDLIAFFTTLKTKGSYYWKLSNDESVLLIRLLCRAYDVRILPEFTTTNIAELKRQRACGLCSWHGGKGCISTFPRPHFKTVAHEVYHHIDFYYRYHLRCPTYNSSDAKNYAWKFGDLLWNALQRATSPVEKKDAVVIAKPPVDTVVKEPANTVVKEATASKTYSEVYTDIETLRAAYVSIGNNAQGWRVPTKKVPTSKLTALQTSVLRLEDSKTCCRKIHALEDGRYVLQWALRA